MRLKLNFERCQGIYNLLIAVLTAYNPENIPESLIDDMMTELSERLRKKLIAATYKDYSIKLSAKEAKAYWTFFSREQVVPAGFEYEENLVCRHLAEIDQLYSPRKTKQTHALSSHHYLINQ